MLACKINKRIILQTGNKLSFFPTQGPFLEIYSSFQVDLKQTPLELIINILMNFQQTTFKTVLCLFLILSPASTVGWQGTGTMEQEKMSAIWTHIGANFGTFVAGGQPLQGYATQLSDSLNSAFAKAWNVVVVQQTDSTWDTVMYGYAFNRHWMWYNGYTVVGSSKYFSFIVWKDYNCVAWHTVGDSDFDFTGTTSNPLYSQVSSAFGSVYPSLVNPYEDVWRTNFKFTDYINQHYSQAFSAIFSQSGSKGSDLSASSMHARICTYSTAPSFLYLWSTFKDDDHTLKMLHIRMR